MEALGHFFNASIVTKTWCFLLPRPNKISQLPSSMQNRYTSCSPARIKGAATSHQLSCQSLMDWQGWESCSKVSREHNSSELSRDEEGWQWLLVYTQIMERSEKSNKDKNSSKEVIRRVNMEQDVAASSFRMTKTTTHQDVSQQYRIMATSWMWSCPIKKCRKISWQKKKKKK